VQETHPVGEPERRIAQPRRSRFVDSRNTRSTSRWFCAAVSARVSYRTTTISLILTTLPIDVDVTERRPALLLTAYLYRGGKRRKLIAAAAR
jgi:hypothetical protein